MLRSILLLLAACRLSDGLVTSAFSFGDDVDDKPVPRVLQGQTQRRVYKSSTATYYLYGYVTKLVPSKPEEAPATPTEAKARCTKLGLDQPDPRSDEDVNAAQFLTQAAAAATYTWIKAAPGGSCGWVTTSGLQTEAKSSNCFGSYPYVCVKRAPKCGKTQCCSDATCCAGRMCCQAGTTCCPPTSRRRYALCVQGGTKCPA